MSEIFKKNINYGNLYPMNLKTKKLQEANNSNKFPKRSSSFKLLSDQIKTNIKPLELLKSINSSYNKKNHCPIINGQLLKYKKSDIETLKIKNKHLKTEINVAKKKLRNVHSYNFLKEKEISKQENLIDEICNIDKGAYSNIIGSFEKDKNFVYPNILINKILSQYNDLKETNRINELKIDKLKKHINNTKKNELLIENNIIKEEFNKYKNLTFFIDTQNKKYEKKLKDKREIEDEILQKNFDILEIQEKLKLNNEININYEHEIEDLKNKIKEYENKNSIMKTNIYELNIEYNKMLMDKKIIEDNYYILYNKMKNSTTDLSTMSIKNKNNYNSQEKELNKLDNIIIKDSKDIINEKNIGEKNQTTEEENIQTNMDSEAK